MATLDQLQSKIQKLQHQADALIAKNASKVLGDIRAMMERHGLTTTDIDAHGANGAKRGPKAASKVAAKPVKSTTVAKDTVAKGQRKGPQPVKYRNAKTGQTWSGRGPAPAWLASVKDRSKFLIDASAEKNAAPPDVKNAAPSKKAKSAVKAVAATKKVASKKPVPAKPVTPTKAVPKKPVAKAVVRTKASPAPKVAAKKAASAKALPGKPVVKKAALSPVAKTLVAKKTGAAKKSAVVADDGAASAPVSMVG
jgi:DNA-binding protein H-NS